MGRRDLRSGPTWAGDCRVSPGTTSRARRGTLATTGWMGQRPCAPKLELARGAGLGGFVYYFYWFNGRRLLDGPLEAMLADCSIDFPFCLMWANENWTRRWDGAEQDVLIAQDYREADEAALAAELARHFADPRYIRLQGRPVLMVYRASLIPDAPAATDRWRAQFRALGEDPVFVMAQSFGDRDPRRFGMDAAVEFPPHKLTTGLELLNPGLHMLDPAATAQVYSYDDLAAASGLDQAPVSADPHGAAGVGQRRRGGKGRGWCCTAPPRPSTQAWLARLVDNAVAHPVLGTPLVCVNALERVGRGRLPGAGRALRRRLPERDGPGHRGPRGPAGAAAAAAGRA